MELPDKYIMEFVRTHGASHPWIFLGIFAFLSCTTSARFAFTHAQRLFIIYASLVVPLHIGAVFMMQAHGPVWRTLTDSLVEFGWRNTLLRFVTFPLLMWPIYLSSITMFGVLAEVFYPTIEDDPALFGQRMLCAGLGLNTFLVALSWLG